MRRKDTRAKNCPSCGKEQAYSSASSLTRAIRKNRKCVSCCQKGRKRPARSKEHKAKLSAVAKDRQFSEETRAKLSTAQHKRWETKPPEPGQETIKQLRYSSEGKAWIRAVISTGFCAYCGSTESLEAHHILSISKHRAWAHFENNGIALCKPCHKQEHKLNGII